jgi:DNA-binding transcriptional LysR family regulator
MDAHTRDLRYFVAVAEELSFTKAAAERLFISQPALSKQIRKLETTLRVRLFDRDRRTVTLTPAGAAMLPKARAMLAQWDEATRAAAAAARERTLTVGFQTRIGRGLIAGVTEAMASLLPEWKLSFRQVPWRDPTAGLGHDDVDVAIAWLPVPSAELSWRVVAIEDRWVALPAGHPLATRTTVTFAELAAQPFVALPAAAGPLRDFWLATDQRDSAPLIAAEAETAEETFEAVAAGLGVALLAAGNAEIYHRDDLVYRPVTDLPPSELAVVWRTSDDRKAIRVFVDACFRCLCAGPPPQHGADSRP